MKDLKYMLILALFAISLFSCQNNQESNKGSELNAGNHKVTIEEVIQASSYTYLKVKENNDALWLATSKNEFKTGAEIYYRDALEMHDFFSKELDRTFDLIYFVQKVSTEAPLPEMQNLSGQTEPQKPVIEKVNIQLEIPEGGISIGDLYSQKEKYNAQSVIVRGQVMKVNQNIMKRNWIHIQDGSGGDDNFDLTITTLETVAIGDIVTFKGTVAVNKDFGSGYRYELILEQGELIPATK